MEINPTRSHLLGNLASVLPKRKYVSEKQSSVQNVMTPFSSTHYVECVLRSYHEVGGVLPEVGSVSKIPSVKTGVRNPSNSKSAQVTDMHKKTSYWPLDEDQGPRQLKGSVGPDHSSFPVSPIISQPLPPLCSEIP